MGQKTHPKGFRLVTTQKHLSNWYNSKTMYPSWIEEDFLLRTKFENVYKNTLTLSKIEITRIENFSTKREHINIKIYALHPRIGEMHKKLIKFSKFQGYTNNCNFSINSFNNDENLKSFINLILKQQALTVLRKIQHKTNKTYNLSFNFIKNIFEDATLIAKYIAEQLEKRIPFRRVVKQTIKKIQYTSKKGLKIQISGRLNGIDIARSEWKREGKIPLHTLNAPIDYTHQEAKTIYGVIGIKVWLYEPIV